jgi:hypothetical protein
LGEPTTYAGTINNTNNSPQTPPNLANPPPDIRFLLLDNPYKTHSTADR